MSKHTEKSLGLTSSLVGFAMIVRAFLPIFRCCGGNARFFIVLNNNPRDLQIWRFLTLSVSPRRFNFRLDQTGAGRQNPHVNKRKTKGFPNLSKYTIHAHEVDTNFDSDPPRSPG